MTVEKFLRTCADTIKDSEFNSISIQEWKDLLNSQSGEIFPEVGYKGTEEVTITTALAETYQIDLSALTNLENVVQCFLEDSKGKLWPYDDWNYLKDTMILDLHPEDIKGTVVSISSFLKVHIIWHGYLSEITKDTDEIVLTKSELSLLRKVCVIEAIRRLLFDMTKLDRYRTQVGRLNEYAMLAIVRDYTREIELQKRKLINTNRVDSF